MKSILAVLSVLAAACTAVSASSGIYDNAGNVHRVRDLDVRGDYRPFHPERIETNAYRLKRGLSPLPPTRRSPSRIAMRPRASPGLCQPLSNTLGYIKVTKVGGGSYTYTSNNALRLSVAVPSTNSFGVPIDITAVAGPDPSYPFVGAVGGSGGFKFASGNVGYAYLSGTGHTNAFSPPSSKVGHSIQALGYNAPAESQIWTLDCGTRALTAQWTNVDGSTVPATVMYDPVVDFIGITGDLGAFNTAFPNERAYAVTLTFVPT
ncbi:hypothetical protein BD779DRAFT_1533602 [Infundibulicybe gibba]|nr:hypothetical protein BD779DRAFT_1533602 [Infundibulicybe gibba]